VRVIATTNRDLPSEVARGTFRQDLYFRLNVLPVQMPALREHAGDVPNLSMHFLGEIAAREGRPVKTVEAAAMDLMCRYPWPGNVRELQNICERAAVLTSEPEICASLIAPWLSGAPAAPMTAEMMSFGLTNDVRSIAKASSMIEVAGSMPGLNGDLPSIVCDGQLTLEAIERGVIVATLEHNQGHRQRSASALGIGVRTLGLKLKKWKELQLVDSTL
jgi:DNA-binding NtrC family response regulator